MIVMKFGGTSVANFEAITRTIFIIAGKLDQKPVVVVSALSKITDLLYSISVWHKTGRNVALIVRLTRSSAHPCENVEVPCSTF